MISALISDTVVSLCGSPPLVVTGDFAPEMKGCVNFGLYKEIFLNYLEPVAHLVGFV